MINDAILPTGTQYEISHGPWQAIVTEQGATLRSLHYEGTDVIKSFDADQSPTSSQGQQLLPWPNRIRDGHYTFDGMEQQLAVSEVDRHNAIHGLVAWSRWSLVEHTDTSVTQTIRIMARPGWPGTISVRLTHRLSDAGLAVEVTAWVAPSTTGQSTPRLPRGYRSMIGCYQCRCARWIASTR